MESSAPSWALRDLPLASRLVVATFLVCLGLGFAAAAVQLNIQRASAGNLLPSVADVTRAYHGGGPAVSKLEHLLEASDGPLNGTGTMRPAFTDESRAWQTLIRAKTPEQINLIRQEREGERLALLNWVRAGAPRASYDADDFLLDESFHVQPITSEFLTPGAVKRVRIRTLLQRRCVECHGEGGRIPSAQLFPLDSHDRIMHHTRMLSTEPMPLARLAQTTHAHLFGFAMLFAITGLLFSLTCLPRAVRIFVAPLPLIAQTSEIACWWLCRLDPVFAYGIVALGGLVAAAVVIQILGTLIDLFRQRPS